MNESCPKAVIVQELDKPWGWKRCREINERSD